MGVGGWGCPISSKAIFNPTAVLLLINKAPTSASAADAITCPPALLLASTLLRAAFMYPGMEIFTTPSM
eukprot:15366875-Ditylum_brightwellii.AAC.1